MNNPLTFQTIKTHLLVGKAANNFKGKKLFFIEKDFLSANIFYNAFRPLWPFPTANKLHHLNNLVYQGAGTQTRTFFKYETFVP